VHPRENPGYACVRIGSHNDQSESEKIHEIREISPVSDGETSTVGIVQ